MAGGGHFMGLNGVSILRFLRSRAEDLVPSKGAKRGRWFKVYEFLLQVVTSSASIADDTRKLGLMGI